jgi:hypothetical protein
MDGWIDTYGGVNGLTLTDWLCVCQSVSSTAKHHLSTSASDSSNQSSKKARNKTIATSRSRVAPCLDWRFPYVMMDVCFLDRIRAGGDDAVTSSRQTLTNDACCCCACAMETFGGSAGLAGGDAMLVAGSGEVRLGSLRRWQRPLLLVTVAVWFRESGCLMSERARRLVGTGLAEECFTSLASEAHSGWRAQTDREAIHTAAKVFGLRLSSLPWRVSGRRLGSETSEFSFGEGALSCSKACKGSWTPMSVLVTTRALTARLDDRGSFSLVRRRTLNGQIDNGRAISRRLLRMRRDQEIFSLMSLD